MYPSEDLRQSFIANDIVNLVMGLLVFVPFGLFVWGMVQANKA
jgi:hypothetical protein